LTSALARGAARDGEQVIPAFGGHRGRKLHTHYGGKFGR